MEETVAIAVLSWLIISTLLSMLFIFGGSFDSDIVESCKKHGEWQMGQHRITCAVVKENV
jgi:hypothetical protein